MSTHIFADVTSQHPRPSDDELLSQMRSGDQQAFGELCLRYNGILKRTLFSIVRHYEDTEDALQDTFLRAYERLHAFRKTCKFSTWLTKIGINTSLMLLLRKRGKLLLSTPNEFETLELRDPAPDLEQAYITDPKFLTLRKAMQKLRPRARSLMELSHGNEPRLKEPAAILGITEATAKSRMLRARRRLRHLLKQQNPDAVNDKRVERPQIRTALAHGTTSP